MQTLNHDKPVIYLDWRPGTQDEDCVREVIGRNEYRVPEYFGTGDTILDLGANIGAFSVLAMVRGCRDLWAYECDPDNFAYLERNLSPFLQAHLFRKAVWRSDKFEKIFYSGHPPQATACGSVVPGCTVGGMNKRLEVDQIGLDRILESTGPVRFCKFDIEGAEYAVFGTAQRLRAVQELAGEVHDLSKFFNGPNLETFFRKQGYYTSLEAGKHRLAAGGNRVWKLWCDRR